MKKIMFNDKYGLTKAVLDGRKTMTRRIIKTPRTMEGKDVYGFSVVKYPRTGVPIEVMALDADGAQINNILPKYKVGEVVAVAQAYKDTWGNPDFLFGDKPGWSNKMFVCADMMPYQIRITNVRVERLQDISDEDVYKEGIQTFRTDFVEDEPLYSFGETIKNRKVFYPTPRLAYAFLIDRVCGNGTWNKNPWVFVYEFELVR